MEAAEICHFFLPSWLEPWRRDCCKIPNASWHMPKACSAPRRGQPLMRTPEPWQPGQVGALELGSQVPVHTAPAASSLAPSEPVSAGPQHLGREVSDQGSLSPEARETRWQLREGRGWERPEFPWVITQRKAHSSVHLLGIRNLLLRCGDQHRICFLCYFGFPLKFFYLKIHTHTHLLL
uniref:Uncharacterized protein n=1 Tax=Spermophilus dauricus TaxID=99837 RepID=A0A8C9P441_SPEDA